jgi:FKBP-type peptidyl-prolyl cis-trans isomerase
MRIASFRFPAIVVVGFIAAGAVFAQQQMPQPPGGPQGGPRAGGPPPGGQAALPGAAQPAADALYRQQVSYVLGRNFGDSLRANGVELDLQTLVAGIGDALQDAKPRWTDAELLAAMQRFDREMRQKAAARLQQVAAKNQQQEVAFLASNKLKEGIQQTASGMQYKVLKPGSGPSPTAADSVRCHYQGSLLDGTVFDSSAGGPPAQFAVRGVIPGWTEALQKMHVGEKWQLFIPSNLAYGMDPPPGAPIEPAAMLIFEIELLEIVKQ